MTGTRTAPSNIEQVLRRAAGYEVLARCFAYPDEGALDGMREVAAMTGHLLADTPLREVLEALAIATQEELEPQYIDCFTLTTSTDVPTFETAYLCTDPNQQTHRMADINGFYRAFGVDAAETAFRPDDICVELEFMSFLCRKEVYAVEHLGAPRVAQARRAQRMFLSEHLGRWAPALGQRTARLAESSPFYRALGESLHAWIEADAAEIAAKIEASAESPQLPWPDRAEQGGIFGAPGGVLAMDDIPVSR